MVEGHFSILISFLALQLQREFEQRCAVSSILQSQFCFNKFRHWINLPGPLLLQQSRVFMSCPGSPDSYGIKHFSKRCRSFKPRSRRSSNRIIQYFNLQFKECNFHRNLISEGNVFSSKKEFCIWFLRILDRLAIASQRIGPGRHRSSTQLSAPSRLESIDLINKLCTF